MCRAALARLRSLIGVYIILYIGIYIYIYYYIYDFLKVQPQHLETDPCFQQLVLQYPVGQLVSSKQLDVLRLALGHGPLK